jgi:hypothetical protein
MRRSIVRLQSQRRIIMLIEKKTNEKTPDKHNAKPIKTPV